METLKALIIHISNMSGQFSQNKRVKLFKQALQLIQENIQNGNEFTRNELLRNDMHLLMF